MTRDAIEQQLSQFQRRLTIEGCDLEDSLRHRFHLLRGEVEDNKSQPKFIFPPFGDLERPHCRTAYSADIVPDEQAHFRYCAQLHDLVC